ncbi:hypothetical protein SAMN05421837_101398 [Amycolatopsis pretoriensis]|uniref:Uncharacterized protein n=1 Tax=Amycolatopsis pretoriensis TaxID=218821 RepID=A0A1H5Q351_9PSEU|nr:hypothetical protein [Amycolatopsis pretoriensis]SEF20523.1 hypothetical protein SAMN05421837_101398 [Amycolatopsis pretoriensis]
MAMHRYRTRPVVRRPRHALPARWWPPMLLAASVAAVIPGDTVGGLLVGSSVLVALTALAAARRVLGHAAVHVNLILAEELSEDPRGD